MCLPSAVEKKENSLRPPAPNSKVPWTVLFLNSLPFFLDKKVQDKKIWFRKKLFFPICWQRQTWDGLKESNTDTTNDTDREKYGGRELTHIYIFFIFFIFFIFLFIFYFSFIYYYFYFYCFHFLIFLRAFFFSRPFILFFFIISFHFVFWNKTKWKPRGR